MEFFKFIFSVIISYSPALVARAFLLNVPDRWYQEIARPPVSPPGWVFGVVWSVLYFLMGCSLFLFCIAEGDAEEKRLGFIFFGIQLLLNAAFMPVCFGHRWFLGGFIICVLLAIFVVLTMFAFYKVSKIAAFLLLPYLLWGLFAIFLSYQVYKLN